MSVSLLLLQIIFCIELDALDSALGTTAVAGLPAIFSSCRGIHCLRANSSYCSLSNIIPIPWADCMHDLGSYVCVLTCSSEWWVLAYMPTAFLSHNIPQVYLCGIIICSALVDPDQLGEESHKNHNGNMKWCSSIPGSTEIYSFSWLLAKTCKILKKLCCLVKMSLIPWSSSKVDVSCKSSHLMEIKLLLRVHRWILYKFNSEGWKC